MKKTSLKGAVMLFITAAIWGCAFVAQKSAMSAIKPFTFQSLRSFLGAVVLLPVIFAANVKRKRDGAYKKPSGADKKRLWMTGILCGALLCTASTLQQFGIAYKGMDSGKAGFITALYILLVPLFGLFAGKKLPLRIWLCVTAALAGLYMLCMGGKSGFSLSQGDILLILCAVVFSFHILAIDKLGDAVDGVRLSCIQFAVSGILAFLPMVIIEKPSLSALGAAALPIVYAGIMSSGVGYTLQVLAQKSVEPAVASLLMSFESVFAVLGGAVILHEKMSFYEYLGCGIMFAAIIVSQLPSKKKIEVKA